MMTEISHNSKQITTKDYKLTNKDIWGIQTTIWTLQTTVSQRLTVKIIMKIIATFNTLTPITILGMHRTTVIFMVHNRSTIMITENATTKDNTSSK